jgi:hypothetical protein
MTYLAMSNCPLDPPTRPFVSPLPPIIICRNPLHAYLHPSRQLSRVHPKIDPIAVAALSAGKADLKRAAQSAHFPDAVTHFV